MKIFQCLLVVIFVLGSPRLAVPDDSLGQQVTVDNAHLQPLRFEVSAVDVGYGTRFVVNAQRGANRQRPSLFSRLIVYDEKTPIVNCQLQSEIAGRSVRYEFIVAGRYLKESILALTVIGEASDLPGGEQYWFYLQDLKDLAAATAKAKAKTKTKTE